MDILSRLESIEHKYEDVMADLSDPEITGDKDRYLKCAKLQSQLEPIVNAFSEYKKACLMEKESLDLIGQENDSDLIALAKDDLSKAKADKEKLEEELKILLIPKDPKDEKNIIIEIRAGAGGEESALFAASLYRMYCKYAEKKGFTTDLLSFEETGLGGFKEIEFMVKGRGAYSFFKYESGVHRVQRVPETESGGRIHTSTATVAVMTEADEASEIVLDPKDYRIDVMRASGNGGQCVNTTDSAVRLTHYPTGIVIYSQTEKSQIQNKAKAFALLYAKLNDLAEKEAHDKEAAIRKSQVGTGDRSEKIRTYNFPQGRVTDHRIGLTLYKIDQIMDGDLDDVVNPLAADEKAKMIAQS